MGCCWGWRRRGRQRTFRRRGGRSGISGEAGNGAGGAGQPGACGESGRQAPAEAADGEGRAVDGPPVRDGRDAAAVLAGAGEYPQAAAGTSLRIQPGSADEVGHRDRHAPHAARAGGSTGCPPDSPRLFAVPEDLERPGQRQQEFWAHSTRRQAVAFWTRSGACGASGEETARKSPRNSRRPSKDHQARPPTGVVGKAA